MKKWLSGLLSLALLFSSPPAACPASAEEGGLARDTVLVLDSSSSMSEQDDTGKTRLEIMRDAAVRFCDQVLKADDGIRNRVGIVFYSSGIDRAYAFSDDIAFLKQVIESDVASGGTNIFGALSTAISMHEWYGAEGAVRNILLMSDGLPNAGRYDPSGRYVKVKHPCANYANTAYELFCQNRNEFNFYTLGFFQGLGDGDRNFASAFLHDLQNSGYYEIASYDAFDFAFGEMAEEITSPLQISGPFLYLDNYSATFFYDDLYFSLSSYEFNQRLATMSLCLAMSAFARGVDPNGKTKEQYSKRSDNARALLEETGFKRIFANEWFTVKPTTDSVGAVAGSKMVMLDGRPFTLIALAVRGGGYESEWASNFTIGLTGEHQGFSQARDIVLSFLRDYISENRITGDIKLWITGYSRASATVNLVAGALDRGESLGAGVRLARPDLYAYCFEPPAGALKSEVVGKPEYWNIFNIVNPADPVPKVAPAAMGFARYGIDKWLPGAESDPDYPSKRDGMRPFFLALASIQAKGEQYVIDDFRMKELKIKADMPDLDLYIKQYDLFFFKVDRLVIERDYPVDVGFFDDDEDHSSQGVFLDRFIGHVVRENIEDRRTYVEQYQSMFREAIRIVMTLTDEQKDLFLEKLRENLISDFYWVFLYTAIAGNFGFEQRMEDIVVESLHEAGITNMSEREIKRCVSLLLALVTRICVFHPELTATLLKNSEGLGQAHYQELCFAWMQSMDPNYTDTVGAAGNGQRYGSGNYRIIRINCPVDVEVRDTEGDTVAAIRDGKPQAVGGSSIIASVNADGEKLLYLPPDAGYSIRMTATDDGVLSYSVHEHSLSAGEVARVARFPAIAIKASEQLSASAAAARDAGAADAAIATPVEYKLFDAQKREILPDADLSGEVAADARFMVYLSAAQEGQGVVSGEGMRTLGSFARISARPRNGYAFDGWYEGDVLVSANRDHRLPVTREIRLTARFMPGPERHDIYLQKTEHGSLSAEPLAAAGEVIAVEARAEEDYRLKEIRVNGSQIEGASFVMPAADAMVEAVFKPEPAQDEQKTGPFGVPMCVLIPLILLRLLLLARHHGLI